MKKIWTLCLLAAVSLFLLIGCGSKKNDTKADNPNYNSENYLSGKHYALIDVANYGEIYVELDADTAPATVTNFVNLVNEGFYDNLTFHRIISGFMIQGGDPDGNGTGGSEHTVPGEFASNGFENNLSHVRGTISMARSNKKDSASSQFFIMHADDTRLDGDYAAFGSVLSGMEVVDAICEAVETEDANGTVLPENQPIINFIAIVEEMEAVGSVTGEQKEASTTPEENIPAPSAQIELLTLTSADNLPVEGHLKVQENGTTYFLSSSADLLGFSVYSIDLTTGSEYDAAALLASLGDIGAGKYYSITVDVPTGLPTLLLVAEEHNGALGKYLINLDEGADAPYLVPFFD